MTAPRGWEVVRLTDGSAPARPSGDDLEALANAVREAARPQGRAAVEGHAARRAADPMEVARRGHLRVLRSPDQ
nr:hypothetical protein [Streptomyces tsukubensis NRRL18488]